MNLTLIESGLLDEVVVTALSIERNSREVVYANQTIGADELISVPNKTALDALQGKLAGVGEGIQWLETPNRIVQSRCHLGQRYQ